MVQDHRVASMGGGALSQPNFMQHAAQAQQGGFVTQPGANAALSNFNENLAQTGQHGQSWWVGNAPSEAGSLGSVNAMISQV